MNHRHDGKRDDQKGKTGGKKGGENGGKAPKAAGIDIRPEDVAAAVKGLADDKTQLPPSVSAAAFASGDFPHSLALDDKPYARDLEALQLQLQLLVDHVRAKGERVVIVFEGRDAAGKGGSIHRVTQHLNPRLVRVVALTKPTDAEAGQWYFQRYVAHMPTRGEIVIFDRSWYNRAGVETVMGFCTPEERERFLTEVPAFEAALTRDGIRFIKLYLSIGREMQLKRLYARRKDPLKRWKLTPIDYESAGRWDAYSDALDRMLAASDTEAAPWTIIKGNDKRRTRLEVIRRILGCCDYAGKDKKLVEDVDKKIVLSAKAFLKDGGEE